MRIGGRVYVVDWGHLLVATLVIAISVAYLLDARATAINVNNLLLVQPAVIFALLLYALILPQCFRRVPDEAAAEQLAAAEAEDTSRPSTLPELLRVAALAAAFGLFVFSLDIVGFDIATWVFMVVGLYICGERRPLPLVVFPLVFTVIAILGYQALIPYPMFTRIL